MTISKLYLATFDKMENKLKASLKMIWIYILLYILDIASTSKVAIFYVSNIFDDTLCESSATKLTGVFPLLSACACWCAQADGCMSFFYDKTKRECYSVNSVLTSTTGCQSRDGMIYSTSQAEHDCYIYTQNDQDMMVSVLESDQCESYQFHVYIRGANDPPKGCEGCSCCQQKGCYDKVSGVYNGTWSQTKNGRRCQRWESQSPHAHEFSQQPSVFEAHNYCRNPDNEDGPWCYTVDSNVRWELCDIPSC